MEKDFVRDHANDQAHPMTKWEALKSVLQGNFIQQGSRLNAYYPISSLESTHKNAHEKLNFQMHVKTSFAHLRTALF